MFLLLSFVDLAVAAKTLAVNRVNVHAWEILGRQHAHASTPFPHLLFVAWVALHQLSRCPQACAAISALSHGAKACDLPAIA
jgi:hypothetical protein